MCSLCIFTISIAVTLSIHQWRFATFPLRRVFELMPSLVRFYYVGRVEDDVDLRRMLNVIACGVYNSKFEIEEYCEAPAQESIFLNICYPSNGLLPGSHIQHIQIKCIIKNLTVVSLLKKLKKRNYCYSFLFK